MRRCQVKDCPKGTARSLWEPTTDLSSHLLGHMPFIRGTWTDTELNKYISRQFIKLPAYRNEFQLLKMSIGKQP